MSHRERLPHGKVAQTPMGREAVSDAQSSGSLVPLILKHRPLLRSNRVRRRGRARDEARRQLIERPHRRNRRQRSRFVHQDRRPSKQRSVTVAGRHDVIRPRLINVTLRVGVRLCRAHRCREDRRNNNAISKGNSWHDGLLEGRLDSIAIHRFDQTELARFG